MSDWRCRCRQQSLSGGLAENDIDPQRHLRAHQDQKKTQNKHFAKQVDPTTSQGIQFLGRSRLQGRVQPRSTHVCTTLPATVLSQHALKQMVSSVPANTHSAPTHPHTHTHTTGPTTPQHSTPSPSLPFSVSSLPACVFCTFARRKEDPTQWFNSTAPRHFNLQSSRVLLGLKLLRVRLQLLLCRRPLLLLRSLLRCCCCRPL